MLGIAAHSLRLLAPRKSAYYLRADASQHGRIGGMVIHALQEFPLECRGIAPLGANQIFHPMPIFLPARANLYSTKTGLAIFFCDLNRTMLEGSLCYGSPHQTCFAAIEFDWPTSS